MKTQEAGGAYFLALGGGSNIGAKMLMVVFPKENKIAIFDVGIGMLPKGENGDKIYLPNFLKLEELVKTNPKYEIWIFLTHGHQDHVGAVPKLKKMFPQAKIFATEPTQGITEVMGLDSIKIRNESGLPPHFTEDNLYECIDSISAVRSEDWINLCEGFAARFKPAGHIRGASTVLLKTPYGIYADSGDISFYDTTTVQGASQKLEDKVRWLSIESTNGDISLPNPETIIQEIIRDTIRIVRNKGNVLIPAFAVGRGPDIAIRLGRELKKFGIPVWSGGLLRRVAEVCNSTHWQSDIQYKCGTHLDHKGKNVFDLNPENIRWVNTYNLDRIASGYGKVVVVPNGMLEAGYSQAFFVAWASKPQNAIYLPGYQAEETRGRELLKLKHRDTITITSPITGWTGNIPVLAEVKQYKISGHADGDQLTNWVYNMNSHDEKTIDKLILVHGDEHGQNGLRAKIQALPNCPKEIVSGKNNEIIPL